MRKEEKGLIIMTIIGAIFCHVSIMKLFIHVNPSMISGNQKWNGALPIFIIKAESNIIIIQLFESWGKNSKNIKIIRIENNKINEARV